MPSMRPVHFEIQSPDPEKSIRFHERVFGWKFSKWDGPMEYWLTDTGEGDGISGGFMRAPDMQPRVVNTITVPSIEEYATKVEAAGGKVVVPKMAIQGVGWVAYCTDPTGVLFGIYRHDSEAR